jgi:hypothetical protein
MPDNHDYVKAREAFNGSSTILCHTGRMDEDQLFLRPGDAPPL